MHADAYVGTMTETDVRLTFPEDVETIGIVPPGLVMVRASEIDRHRRALGNVDPVELDVAGGLAHEVEQRGFPADALLDRLRQQAAIGDAQRAS